MITPWEQRIRWHLAMAKANLDLAEALRASVPQPLDSERLHAENTELLSRAMHGLRQLREIRRVSDLAWLAYLSRYELRS
jgi:hypothetical protein